LILEIDHQSLENSIQWLSG